MERTVRRHVIPWMDQYFDVRGRRVLEIGCGEGGNLIPFLALECQVVGLDWGIERIERARQVFSERTDSDNITFIEADAMEFDYATIGRFDLIVLKDFIEHVDQRPFLFKVKEALKPDGVIFIGFPPWQMPFGGHQQTCRSALGRLPWIHLLPTPLYLNWLRLIGESEALIANKQETKRTGISIEKLRRLFSETGYVMIAEKLYFINPGYEAKFNLKPKEKLPLVGDVPYLRNYVNTACYALVSLKAD